MGPCLADPADVLDEQLLFLCEETGLGDTAMSHQAQTFLSPENVYETCSLAIPGPKHRRFALQPRVFDSLPFVLEVFWFLLDFAFSLQLCFLTDFKYSFQNHVLSKMVSSSKLNLKVFAHTHKILTPFSIV